MNWWRGPSRRKRIGVAAALLVAALVVIQFVTYWHFAEAHMPAAAVGRLVRMTESAGCDFVCVEKETRGALTAAQWATLERELEQGFGTVYLSIDAVPDEFKVYWNSGSGRELAAFKFGKGLKVRWILSNRGLFWMSCDTSVWTSCTGASLRGEVFVWMFGCWVKVYTLYSAAA